MPRLKIKPGNKVDRITFEKFEKDLKILVKAFPSNLVAKWWGKAQSHLSRKLNGYEAITRKDIVDFYRKMGALPSKLENGVEPYQIELEMSEPTNDEIGEYKNLYEEIRLLNDVMARHNAAIKQLQEAVFGPKGPQKAQST